MRRLLNLLTVLTLVLAVALAPTSFAESPDTLQAVYDALVAEGSDFNQSRDMYASYFEGVSMDAVLENDRIVITLDSTNEYVESGSWTFALDGDNLTTTLSAEDFYGSSMVMILFQAVAASRGVNSSLLNGYIAGLGENNPYLIAEADENAGTSKYSIPLNASYDFEGLDQMVMTEDTVYFFGALDEDYTSKGGNYGKVVMVMNGNVHSLTMLICEYGELDDVAYQDIINAVSATKPDGWETFVAEYTELKNVETADYSVVLNADDAQVGEIIEDRYEDYVYAIVRIGQDASGEDDENITAQLPEPGWVLDSVNGAVWQDDRASLEVFLEDVDNYKVMISWAGSAWEQTEWVYACDYDAETQTLKARCVVCDSVVYDDAGNETRTNLYEKDSSDALFSLNEEGKVLLQNVGDEQLEGKTFGRSEE